MKIQYNVQPPPKKAAFGGAKCEEVQAIEQRLDSLIAAMRSLNMAEIYRYRRLVW